MSEANIVFAGTPDFAAIHLQALLNAGVKICAVYTQPDRPSGRGRKLQKSPVKQVAEAAGIAVYQPQSLRDVDAQQQLASLQPDLMIVVAYGLILPQIVLDTPRLGCVNVHASLLPRWRGAAPIHRALLAGDTVTGVTLMQMEAGLDTGPMLAKVETSIDTQESSGELHDRLASLGSQMLVTELAPLLAGELNAMPQDEAQANYAHKLEKQEGQIDWQHSCAQILRQVRGLNPWPVAYTQLGDINLRVWAARPGQSTRQATPGTLLGADKAGIEVACGDGSVLLTEIQMPGGKRVNAAALLNSNTHPFIAGTHFG